MARLVALCPLCGAPVTPNAATEWVSCAYCRATSLVETAATRGTPDGTQIVQKTVRVHVHDSAATDNLTTKEQRLALFAFGLFALVLWSFVMWLYGPDILGAVDSSSGKFALNVHAAPP